MPMAINKSKSPLWVRIVVWFLVIGLIAGIGILSVVQVGSFWRQGRQAGQSNQSPEELTNALNAYFQPQVDELRGKVEANPEDLESTTKLAELYLAWAVELSKSQDQSMQLMAQLYASQSLEFWEKAAALDPGDTKIAEQVAQLKNALNQGQAQDQEQSQGQGDVPDQQ